MTAQLPYPELVDRDTTTPDMQHVARSLDVYLCGAPRDPNRPFSWGSREKFDCIVCLDLWDQRLRP